VERTITDLSYLVVLDGDGVSAPERVLLNLPEMGTLEKPPSLGSPPAERRAPRKGESLQVGGTLGRNYETILHALRPISPVRQSVTNSGRSRQSSEVQIFYKNLFISRRP